MKNLEKLYFYIISHPETTISTLSKTLNCNSEKIIKLLSKLKQMGLDISIENDNINLNNHVDVININYIIAQNKTSKTINYVFSTTSTNHLAAATNQPSVFISDYQSEGKGRLERKWITPIGQSIAISITHDFSFGLHELSGLNIAIGVAIINTAQQFGRKQLETPSLKLKWPNDLLGNKGKVAGILIQASGNKQKSRVIIGIGINWQVRQTLLDSIEQDCMNINIKQVSRTEFILELLHQIEAILDEFSQNKLKNIKAIWNQHDAFTGKMINILQDNKTWQAHYHGINSQGHLQVEKSGIIKTLASGEVSIRKAPT